MDSLKEQRIAVKFCVKLGKSATETVFNSAYGDVATKRTVSSGMSVSRVADSRMTTMNVMGVL